MTIGEGATCDFRTIFGDAGVHTPHAKPQYHRFAHTNTYPKSTAICACAPQACSSANRIEDMLLWFIRHLIFKEWDMPKDPEMWLAHIQTLDWVTEDIKQWMVTRAELWGAPQADLSLAENTERIWGCIPCVITGL